VNTLVQAAGTKVPAAQGIAYTAAACAQPSLLIVCYVERIQSIQGEQNGHLFSEHCHTAAALFVLGAQDLLDLCQRRLLVFAGIRDAQGRKAAEHGSSVPFFSGHHLAAPVPPQQTHTKIPAASPTRARCLCRHSCTDRAATNECSDICGPLHMYPFQSACTINLSSGTTAAPTMVMCFSCHTEKKPWQPQPNK